MFTDRHSIAVMTRASIDFPSRIGVWWAGDTWAMPDAQQVARDVEGLGFGSLFIPEVVGKECLTQSAAFLAATGTTRGGYRHRQHPRPGAVGGGSPGRAR